MHIETWPGLTPYNEALSRQLAAVDDVLNGGPERAFLLEHEPVFTVGTSGSAAAEVLDAGNIPVIETGRGGKVTYHGPGQRVAYVIADLRQGKDLRAYIKNLQNWLITSLADLGVAAFSNDDIGVWVKTPGGDAKIAAIGVRVRKWVAFHGVALNVHPDLAAYSRIIPCGLEKPVTSLADMGKNVTLPQLDEALAANIQLVFSQRS